jgi:hypothetical protein
MDDSATVRVITVITLAYLSFTVVAVSWRNSVQAYLLTLLIVNHGLALLPARSKIANITDINSILDLPGGLDSTHHLHTYLLEIKLMAESKDQAKEEFTRLERFRVNYALCTH